MSDPITVLDHGFIRLVDSMGTDHSIAEAARVSYGNQDHDAKGDEKLIRYLLRHDHGTPFEMVVAKWYVKCPIFVARQWFRHRIGSFNEISGRYKELPADMYVPEPENVKLQSSDNKQGRGDTGTSEWADAMIDVINDAYSGAYHGYSYVLAENVAKELARITLPLGTYTEFYWSVNLRSLFNFLRLRLDEHAQWEIRQYAEVIAGIVAEKWPMAYRAFEDFQRNALHLSAQESEIADFCISRLWDYDREKLIRYTGYNDMSPSERREFREKFSLTEEGE